MNTLIDKMISTIERQNQLISDTLKLLEQLNQIYNVQQHRPRKD